MRFDRKRNWRAIVGYVIALAVAAVCVAETADMVRSGHEFHVLDMEFDCVECHSLIPDSKEASDWNAASHYECFECHDGDYASDDCELCHTNPDEAMAKEPVDRGLYFSHEAHLAMDVDCERCHKEAGYDALDELVYGYPEMSTCTDCHDGRHATARCDACHTVVDTLLPQDHLASWTQNHGQMSRTEIETCAQCHVQEQDCDMCHRGDNLQGIPHAEGFLASHSFSFYRKTKDCSSCHDYSVNCVSCHTARRVYPINHSLAGWATEDGHGEYAEGDMESCAACHEASQPTCLRCHLGGDIDGD